MIVDLLRNDLGRIAEIGSVEVTDLFTVETYRTVHQMTSGIARRAQIATWGSRTCCARCSRCGSVTGAPKVRAMEIISELEASRAASIPAPSAISRRRATRSSTSPSARVVSPASAGEMGIGSGIVADSKTDAEFEECLLKAQFLTKVDTPFELIETLRFEQGAGFHLLERHLARLQSSAAHFGYPFSREAVLAALDAEAARVDSAVALVRLLLGEDGAITVTSTAITLPTKDTVWRFVISDQRLDEKDPFFYHKTTRRQFYDREMERQKAADRLRRGGLPQQEG